MGDKFPTICSFIIVLVVAIAAASQENSPSGQGRTEDKPNSNGQLHSLRVASEAEYGLRISGSQHISCKSRWHDIRLPCRIRGTFVATERGIGDLLPVANVSIGEKWEIDETRSNALARRLFTALKITAADAETFAHWTGTGSEPNPVEAKSQLTGVLRSVKSDKQNRVANIRLTGEMQIVESGKMSSRYGPNWWKSNWRMNLQVDLALNLADGQLHGLHLSAKGAVTGAYYNSGELREPFTAEVDFQASLPKPLSPQQILQIEKLIEALADDSFIARERATNDLRKFGREAAQYLRNAARNAQDAEARYRLRRLAHELSE